MSRLSLCKQSQLHITFHNNYERTLNFHDNLPLDGAVSREPRISQEDGDMYDEFTYESGLRVDGEEAFAIAMQDLKTKAARYPDIVDFPGLPHVLLNSLIVLPGELFDGKTRTAEIANLAAVADWVRAYNSYLVIECPAAQKMVIEEWVGEGAVNFIEPQDPKGLNPNFAIGFMF